MKPEEELNYKFTLQLAAIISYLVEGFRLSVSAHYTD